jgi:hypothetical protein
VSWGVYVLRHTMEKRALAAGVLLGLGLAAAGVVFTIESGRRATLAERPAASGDTGMVIPYGLLDRGPIQLVPDQVNDLPRPQTLSFSFWARGTGPRVLRFELEGLTEPSHHEERVSAPADQVPLGFLMNLDGSIPDLVTLVITIEAPHTRSLTARYPLRLH